ncbi:MAG: glycine zipper 2TM domain-containing protein [Xanthomonadaceae bacterium]|nr:glycine zipper 2TM domain-containing protein [Xanthomonadaceae bacterium]
MNSRDRQPSFVTAPAAPPALGEDENPQTLVQDDKAMVEDNSIQVQANETLRYADIIKVTPINERQRQYATVISSDPIRETVKMTVPKEVCEDVTVQERLPERDGNVGGTVAGAVIGGVLGNQVGSGRGRKAATVVGAVAGGVIGNQVDKRHEGGRIVTRTERQCRTENEVSESSHVTGYNVVYRNANGTTGTMKMTSKPADRIAMGTVNQVVGYNVTYRYNDQESTIRMNRKPEGDRLPVVDGKVVTQAVALSAGASNR